MAGCQGGFDSSIQPFIMVGGDVHCNSVVTDKQ
jgi:hypothetical protein